MAATTANSVGLTSTQARQAAQQYLDSRLQTSARSDASKPFHVPTIDLSSALSGSSDGKAQAATQIREACLNSGFFQITGHGVPTDARRSILTQAERIFKTLTPAQKEKLHVQNSRYMRGWEPSDYTYVNPSDWDTETVPETKEGFNWGYQKELDSIGGDGRYAELDGAKMNGNVWPSEDDLPGLFEGIKVYYSEVLRLARCLFRLFALSLELQEGYFDEMITHPGAIGRLLFYPPSKDPKPLDNSQKDKEIGLGAHSDYECFTILLSSTTHGLEILSPDNSWTEVEAAENGLIVNIGDFLMRWTNGLYKSTVHRVVNRTMKERYSIPIFISINYDQLVETLPSCVSEHNPSKFPPVRAGEYILERLRATTKEG